MICNKEPYIDNSVKTITVTPSYVSSGSIDVKRRGNVVQVYFRGVTFSQNGQSMKVASGLPAAALQQSIVFSSSTISDDDSVWIADTGTDLYANVNSAAVAHWGGMTYITSET